MKRNLLTILILLFLCALPVAAQEASGDVTEGWRVALGVTVASLVVFVGASIAVARYLAKQGDVRAQQFIAGLREGLAHIPLDRVPQLLNDFKTYSETTPNKIDDALADGSKAAYGVIAGLKNEPPAANTTDVTNLK